MELREWMEIDQVTFETWSRAVAYFAKEHLKMENTEIKSSFKKNTSKGGKRFLNYYISVSDRVMDFKSVNNIPSKVITIWKKEKNGSSFDSYKGLRVKNFIEEEYVLLLIHYKERYFITLYSKDIKETQEES